MSGEDCPLSSICKPSKSASAYSISLIHPSEPTYRTNSPSALTELVTGLAIHMELLLANLTADHTFVVQPSDSDAKENVEDLSQLAARFLQNSLLWAVQAHRAAKHPSKMSFVTFGVQSVAETWQRRPSPLQAACLGVSRTLFMEDRGTYGTALDIWPPSNPPDQQVNYVLNGRVLICRRCYIKCMQK